MVVVRLTKPTGKLASHSDNDLIVIHNETIVNNLILASLQCHLCVFRRTNDEPQGEPKKLFWPRGRHENLCTLQEGTQWSDGYSIRLQSLCRLDARDGYTVFYVVPRNLNYTSREQNR